MVDSTLIDELANSKLDAVMDVFIELPVFSSVTDYEAVIEVLVLIGLSASILDNPAQLLNLIDTLAIKAAKKMRNMEASGFIC